MNNERLKSRLDELKRQHVALMYQHQQLTQEVQRLSEEALVIFGAIQDCEFWLTQETSTGEPAIKLVPPSSVSTTEVPS